MNVVVRGGLRMDHLVVAIAIAASIMCIGSAQQPTSFNFDKIRYTFYPGEVARSWDDARGFCKDLGKELAVFKNRGQILNVSEFLSANGGVWTGYKANTDGEFEVCDGSAFVWKDKFGIPGLQPIKGSVCGLLGVGNGTGIRPVDCSLKKAALCSIQSPGAENDESGKVKNEESGKVKNDNGKSKETAISSKSGSSSKGSSSASSAGKVASDGKNTTRPATSSVSPKPTTSPVKTTPPTKSPSDKGQKSYSSPVSSKSSSSSSSSSASESKKPVSPKKGSTKYGDKDGNSKPDESVDDDEEPEMPSPMAQLEQMNKNVQKPVKIEADGALFTFFPNRIMFGGYMEFSRFCEDKGLQPAVFANRKQMENVAKQISGYVHAWTGYSTDSDSVMHSVDEISAPWLPDLVMVNTTVKQPLMCGVLSSAPEKVGVYLNSCASPHEALCSAKTFRPAVVA